MNETENAAPVKSLFDEVVKLREQQADLTKAVRALCGLMSVLDKKVSVAIDGGSKDVGAM
jgi:hypothetical protein